MNSFTTFLSKNRLTVVLSVLGTTHLLYMLFLTKNSNVGEASLRSFLSFLALGFFTLAIERIQRYFHSGAALSTPSLGLVLLFALLNTFLFISLQDNVNLSQLFYSKNVHSLVVLANFFILSTLYLSFVLLLFWTDRHTKIQQETTKRLVERERQLTKAELSNIQEQFKPHFLFNSLNSISALTTLDPEKAQEMTIALSDFFRESLQRHKEEWVSLEKELEFVRLYLSIEKMRFGDRLLFEEMNQLQDVSQKIPAMILQPIIENAIKFGVYDQLNVCKIELKITLENNWLLFKISNPYQSQYTVKKGSGYGLSSIRRKLEIHYKRNDLLNFGPQEDLFVVELKIPINESNNH